ncbi:MAG: ATP-dependent DNA helicase [Candidatus Acidiferrum sp.]
MNATLFEMGPLPDSGLKLNAAQRRAITHGSGPLLVIAGAGTGKTRVITERIKHLLSSDAALLGENILALTFTNKAAGEMRSRVAKSTGERGKGLTIETFHSFCQGLLKEIAPDRKVLEKVDHWILLRRNMRRLRLEKYRKLAEPGQFLNDFLQFFSRCQDELVSSADYARFAEGEAQKLEAERGQLDEDTYRERLEEVGKQREIARAYQASDDLLREKNAVALNGLITDAVALLENDAAKRATLEERYKHILVDEFQDTNIAQLRLLELLCAEPRNIVVVGDNDQAIYRFRGASFGSFKMFLERFAGWKQGQDSGPFRVALTENYRSTPNILRVAQQVIAQNEVSADFPNKILSPNKSEGERIRIAELADPPSEALWVANELERLHGAGRRWKDLAVLYRQHAHRDDLVEELSRRTIPFVISRLSILVHPLVRDVLAYLRLIAKPFDDVACARILAMPAWEMQPEDLLRLAERAKRERRAIYDILQSPQGQLAFDTSHGKTDVLLAFLLEQRKTMRRRTAREILSDLLEWLEIAQRAGERDQKTVARLTEFVKAWEPKSDRRDLAEFLEYLDYYQQANETICLEDESPGDAVQLMTVHGAKGLEFSHVFLLRVNSRAFPSSERAPLFEFPLSLMKEELPEGSFHIQEERRLFYVALTRAEDRLTITTVTDKKGKVPVFIEDMVMDPAIKRRDVRQLAPKVTAPAQAPRYGAATLGTQALFPAAIGPAKIFSRIGQWAESYQTIIPEPLKLSPSSVEAYRKCPAQYLFEKLWSLDGAPKATLTFGRVMHQAIKRFLAELRRGNRIGFDELKRLFDTEWSEKGYEDEYQQEEYYKDGLEQLKVFHAAMLAASPEILEQEKAFELPMANNVIISGRFDQVNALNGPRGKNVEIVDFKTGRPRSDADARKNLQLSIYALAAREIFEWNPVRLVFHYLQNNQLQVTTREKKDFEEAERKVQETAADIRAGEFGAKSGFVCRSCAYRMICPEHEAHI